MPAFKVEVNILNPMGINLVRTSYACSQMSSEAHKTISVVGSLFR